jgi:hypothetical protein
MAKTPERRRVPYYVGLAAAVSLTGSIGDTRTPTRESKSIASPQLAVATKKLGALASASLCHDRSSLLRADNNCWRLGGRIALTEHKPPEPTTAPTPPIKRAETTISEPPGKQTMASVAVTAPAAPKEDVSLRGRVVTTLPTTPKRMPLRAFTSPSAPPAPTTVGGYPPASDFVLLAGCESAGNWRINTGNGYYGGVQFSETSWLAEGGATYAAYPNLATEAQQITIAQKLYAVQGWGAWPACSYKVGLR